MEHPSAPESPHLGEIQARIGLTGHQISLHLTAANPDTREQLRGHGQGLASQFEAAGLTLGGFMVDKNEPDATPEDRRSAVALAYLETDAAPRVVAKGRGAVAQAIINRAKEHGVYVHESPELVALLMQVDLDERIPLSSTGPSPNCWPGSIDWSTATTRHHRYSKPQGSKLSNNAIL